jgi:metal-dependent hydrolase (beta-lactamase superfamily II)
LICELSSSSIFQITLGVHERKKKEEQIAPEVEKALGSSPLISCHHCSWQSEIRLEEDSRPKKKRMRAGHRLVRQSRVLLLHPLDLIASKSGFQDLLV